MKHGLSNSVIFARGEENTDFAQYFVGRSYLNILSLQGVVIGNVTFEPGCRNNWHIHQASQSGGQILLCTGGRGWYQEWGRNPENSMLVMWSISPQASSTGMAQPKTVGSSTWR